MTEGQKVSNYWGPILGSPIVNVSRVQSQAQLIGSNKNYNSKTDFYRFPGSYMDLIKISVGTFFFCVKHVCLSLTPTDLNQTEP